LKKKYEFLEHTADAYVAAYGSSLEEAFENAALATSNVMTDTCEVKPKVEEQVEIEAKDEYALLYNWLEEIIVKFDIENRLYSRFKISIIRPTSDGFRLEAKIWGEPFDPGRHSQRVGVKAVTYHRMTITKEPDRATVKFILDI
jgi:SHS2 domain-containing protein